MLNFIGMKLKKHAFIVLNLRLNEEDIEKSGYWKTDLSKKFHNIQKSKNSWINWSYSTSATY
jgi:hypothetical protein